MPRRVPVVLALAAALLCTPAPVALAATGSLWTSPAAATAPVVSVDPVGRSVLAATLADGRVQVERLLASGRTDPAFGAPFVDFGVPSRAVVVGTAPDGSILVGLAVGDDDAGVARVSADGRLLSAAVVARDVEVRDAAIDASGRVVLAGAERRTAWAARFSAAGEPDARFAYAPDAPPVEAVATAGDDVVVARGEVVERLGPDGAPLASAQAPFAVQAVAADRDGEVLAGGDGLVRVGDGDAFRGVSDVRALAVRCDGAVGALGGALVRFGADGGLGLSLPVAGTGTDLAASPDGAWVVAGTVGDRAFVDRTAGEPCAARSLAAAVPVDVTDAAPVVDAAEEVVAVARSTTAPADVPFVPAAPRRARAATAVADALQAVRLPSERRCVARRRMAVRIDVPRGAAVIDVTLLVDGRRAVVRRGTGRWSTATLRGLPKRSFAVEVAVRMADETTLRAARRYRPCRP